MNHRLHAYKKAYYLVWYMLLVLSFPPFAAAACDNTGNAVEKQLDHFFQQHLSRIKAPGFSVVVIKKEKVLLCKGYGTEGLDGKIPVTKDTVMTIASFTKTLTAMAIMQLEERNLLDIEDPVIKYLPWFQTSDKAMSDTITIKMCLSHSTGIKRQQSKIVHSTTTGPDALEKGVRDLRSYPMAFKPGTSFGYMNEGFNILGLIIEKITGIPYEQYIAQNIFSPLSMSRASMVRRVIESMQPATGNCPGIVPTPAPFIHVQNSLPAGSGTYMDAQNLGHYLMAMANGGRYQGTEVLSEQSIRRMWTPTTPPFPLPYSMGGADGPVQYGLGWVMTSIDGHTYFFHPGGYRNMSCHTLVDPENNMAVGLLLNTGMLNKYTSQSSAYACYNALQIAKGMPLADYGIPGDKDPTLNEFMPKKRDLEKYMGRFLSEQKNQMVIKSGGTEGLQAFTSGGVYQADYDVDFINDTDFVMRNIKSRTQGSFTQSENGEITAVTLGTEVYNRQ